MRKKALSMLMGLVLGVTTIFSSVGTTGVTVYAAENGVTDAECTDKDTAAPTPDDTVPDANQYKYQKDELAAFCHFGPNTFNELEWGFDQSTQKKLYAGRTPDQIFTLESDFDAETLVTTLKNAGFKKLIVTAKHHDGLSGTVRIQIMTLQVQVIKMEKETSLQKFQKHVRQLIWTWDCIFHHGM